MQKISGQIITAFQKGDGTVLKTYRYTSGKITHVLTGEIPGRGIYRKIIKCDAAGNPQKLISNIPGKEKEVYTKAADGSTIQMIGKKIKEFPTLIFNTVASMFLK